MEENSKDKRIDMTQVEAFYEAIMSHKDALKKIQDNIDNFEKNGKNEYSDYSEEAIASIESLEQKTEGQEKILAGYNEYKAKKEEYEQALQSEKQEVDYLSGSIKGIRQALSKFMEDANQKIEKTKSKIAKYSENIERIKAEIEQQNQMIAAETDEDLKLQYQYELRNKARSLASFEYELKKINSELSDITTQMEAVKAKFAKYIYMSKEDLETIDEKEKVNDEIIPDENKEKSEDKEKTAEDKDKEAPEDDGKEKENETGDEPVIDGDELEGIIDNIFTDDVAPAEPKTEPSVRTGSVVQPQSEVVNDVEKPETDKEAYARIAELLKDRKTRYSISNDDKDRITAILANFDNYDALKIQTRRPFGIFSSKSDKVIKNLGKVLKKDIADAGVRANFKQINKEFTNRGGWRDTYSVSNNWDKEMQAERDITASISKAETEERIEDLVNLKTRIAEFRKAFTTQFIIGTIDRNDMGQIAHEMAKVSGMLRSSEEVAEPSSEHIDTPEKSKGLDLSAQVKTAEEVAKQDAEKANEKVITTDEKEIETEGFVIEE